jgi:hypothetical protein
MTAASLSVSAVSERTNRKLMIDKRRLLSLSGLTQRPQAPVMTRLHTMRVLRTGLGIMYDASLFPHSLLADLAFTQQR